MPEQITVSGVLARWAGAFFLLAAVYNPTGYSYYHWVTTTDERYWSFKIVAGIILYSFFALYFNASLRALRLSGLMLISLASGLATYILFPNPIDFDTPAPQLLVFLQIVIANILAVGASWSYVRQMLSGQLDVNNINGGL
ncbi:MAG: hypothetical protein EBY21_00650 [Alphaproteobacteria bacterium]|nr:hypothetical protein [Alphaproteobacteria bacterium]